MNARRPYRPQLESLEARQLMAGDLTASFANGVLTIEGTEEPDTIVVRNNYGIVSVDGTNLAVWASNVKTVVVDSLGGDDRIWISAGMHAFSPLALVDAGAGIDLVVGGLGVNMIAGGEGHDLLFGGTGLDVIFGGDGDDMIFGLAGDDVLFGQNGNDSIYGGDGHDLLFGGQGSDRLYGGNGMDILHGGAGADELYGQAGDDYLFYDWDDVALHVNRLVSGKAGTIDGGSGAVYYRYNGGDAEMTQAIQAQNTQRNADLLASSFQASQMTSVNISADGQTGFQFFKKLWYDDQVNSDLSPYRDADYAGGFRADTGYAMGY